MSASSLLSVLPVLEVTVQGRKDLLMHNGELANGTNPIVQEIKKLTALRKKTDSQKEELARWSLVGSAYFDEEVGFYIPTWNVEANLAKAGSRVRLKEVVKEAVNVLVEEPHGKDDRIKIVFPKGVPVPTDPAKMFRNPLFHDDRGVNIKKNKIQRDRAKIPTGWQITFQVEYDSDLLSESQVRELLKIAGRMGLGDYRPRFGQYTIISVDRLIDADPEAGQNGEEGESNE